jgi:hypothetical protein
MDKVQKHNSLNTLPQNLLHEEGKEDKVNVDINKNKKNLNSISNWRCFLHVLTIINNIKCCP